MSLLPVGIGNAGGEYTIDNSLRFRSSASAYLSWTPASAGNRKTWTWSGWIKRGKISNGTNQLFCSRPSGTSNEQFSLSFLSTDKLYVFSRNPSDVVEYTFQTNALFRDPSAWYHILFYLDTTQSTAADRMALYVNGVKQTFATVTYPTSQNLDCYLNQNIIHFLGSSFNDGYLDGYLTEVNFIDGQALDPTDFGETDTDTGVWKPKEYTGTYGTNGFYLPTTATTQAEGFNTVLYTGTGSTQTVSGVGFNPDLVWIKIRSSAARHVLVDSVRGSLVELYSDLTNADSLEGSCPNIRDDGFEIQNGRWGNSGATYVGWCWDAGANQTSTGVSSILYYGNGQSRKLTGFGFSPDLVWIKKRGPGTNTTARDHVLFDTVRGANKQLKSSTTGAEATQTDEVMSFDSDGFTAGASDNVNGSNAPYIAWGWDAGDGDPVSNTQGTIPSTVKASDATGFSIVTYTGTGTAGDTVGHGLSSAPDLIICKDRDTATSWPVYHSGLGGTKWTLLNSTLATTTSAQEWNNTDPTSTVFTVGNASSNSNQSGDDYVAYCFSEVSGVSKFGSYTGTGTTGKTVTGLGFKPGFIIVKRTDAAEGWQMLDSTRNPFAPHNSLLEANQASAEITNSSRDTTFDSDGFTINNTSNAMNASGGTYIYMAFKGSYSDYVSPLNTDGDIDSRVKANPEKGFSIVSWEGNSGTNQSVAHGLGVKPSLVIHKDRSATSDWFTYTDVIDGSLDFLRLNTTAAKGNSGASVPDSDYIYVTGTTAAFSNAVSYCFASVSGYSKIDSYTGSGVSGSPTVTTGFKPAWLVIKRSDSTGNWMMYDNTRDPSNEAGKRIYADLSNAEQQVSPHDIEFTDTGFIVNNNGGSTLNASGGTYLYMAFAETRDAQFNFDASGNKNNWTPNNINSNASSETSYDIMTDVPTLTDENTANYATLNSLTLNAGGGSGSSSDGNLKWIGTGGNDSLFGTMAASSGKWYYEIEIVATPTTLVAGWSTTDELADYTQSALVYYNSAGIRNGNRTVVWNTNVTTGLTFANGDLIGFALDIDSGDLKVYQNNSLVSTITLPTDKGDKWIPAFGDSSATDASFTVNFGQQPFRYTPPTGFLPLNTYNLPDSTIVDGSEQFNTVLYTGNGSTQSITGVGFQPDFAWFKARSIAYAPQLVDAVRGAGNVLLSDRTDAEATYDTVTSFDSDGVTLDGSTYAGTNGSGETFASWYWKANGSGVTNSAGTNGASIASTYSANTTSGLSVVTYTGTGSNETVYHGIGTAPEMIIVKDRSQARNWFVYHAGLTSASYNIFLNLTNAQTLDTAFWNSTAPGANVFSIGGNHLSGAGHVAYCFAPVEGFSAFGSYTGNGSTDGPFIYTGFRPAFLLVKRADGVSNWAIYDTVRNPYNVSQYLLYADSNTTEGSGSGAYIDFLSNGFKWRGLLTAGNGTTGTYIYAAFAENPFKNSLAR